MNEIGVVLSMVPVLVAGALFLFLTGLLLAWPVVLFITAVGSDPVHHTTLWENTDGS